MATCEFLFDLGSAYSYLASTQIDGLEQRTGVKVQLVPIVLGAVFKAVGAELAPAHRFAWMQRDLTLWMKRYGIPLIFPSAFPTKTILGLRTILAARQGAPGDDKKAMHALFTAYWTQSKDIGQPEVVKAALDEAGLDAAALIAATEDKQIKDALRTNTERAVERGAFGAPTFFVGDEFFFGNDRLDFVEAALRSNR